MGASKFGGTFDVKLGGFLQNTTPARFLDLTFATSSRANPDNSLGVVFSVVIPKRAFSDRLQYNQGIYPLAEMATAMGSIPLLKMA